MELGNGLIVLCAYTKKTPSTPLISEKFFGILPNNAAEQNGLLLEREKYYKGHEHFCQIKYIK